MVELSQCTASWYLVEWIAVIVPFEMGSEALHLASLLLLVFGFRCTRPSARKVGMCSLVGQGNDKLLQLIFSLQVKMSKTLMDASVLELCHTTVAGSFEKGCDTQTRMFMYSDHPALLPL